MTTTQAEMIEYLRQQGVSDADLALFSDATIVAMYRLYVFNAEETQR